MVLFLVEALLFLLFIGFVLLGHLFLLVVFGWRLLVLLQPLIDFFLFLLLVLRGLLVHNGLFDASVATKSTTVTHIFIYY